MKVLLVIYDNESYTNIFPIASAYIASALLDAGHDVEIYNQDIYHYPNKHLTNYLDNVKFDVVGLGIIGGYYQYKKMIAISNAINRSKNRPVFVLGGHGPSPEPEYFLKKSNADVVILGEGEKTIVDLLSALEENRNLDAVDGIAFRKGGFVKINKKRPVIKNINNISLPAYHLFPVEIYRLFRPPNSKPTDFCMPMLTGRGCPFQCNFCYRIEKGFRARSNKNIINEIKFLKERYGVTYISFYDELLMVSEKRTVDFCNELIEANLDIRWECSGRLNYAKPNVIKIMKKAGCIFINYGIECFDNKILKNMNKSLNTGQIISGVENTMSEGVACGLNVIFGNIGENKETLKRSLDFILKYSNTCELRTIRPVTPYPGSPLYYYAINSGLLKDAEDFYENKHVNSDLLSVNFTNLTDEEFHQALLETNTLLIKNYTSKKYRKIIEEAQDLYLNKRITFRGFRKI